MADLKYLNRLSRDYPNIKAASAEIINLRAILALPKGSSIIRVVGQFSDFLNNVP